MACAATDDIRDEIAPNAFRRYGRDQHRVFRTIISCFARQSAGRAYWRRETRIDRKPVEPGNSWTPLLCRRARRGYPRGCQGSHIYPALGGVSIVELAAVAARFGRCPDPR